MTEGHRRIDRIREPAFVEGLDALGIDDLRARRDECLSEREYLSLLRRLVQGRAEILQAEIESRRAEGELTPLIDRLAEILTADEVPTESRGEVVRVGLPEEEMLLARRRVERLVADAGISDPATLDDRALEAAVDVLHQEERVVSDQRRAVLQILDTVQAELKRRYKDDPTLALR